MVEPHFDDSIEVRRVLLNLRLVAVNARAQEGLLPSVTSGRSGRKVTPIKKSTPPNAAVPTGCLCAVPLDRLFCSSSDILA